MISLLASGNLISKPVRRVSQSSGREFVTAQIRSSADGGESFVLSLIAFDKAVCASLLALDKNDSVCVTGPGKPSGWTSKDGSPALGLSIVAQQVLTAYRLREKRKVANSKEPYLPAASPLLDRDEDGSALF